MKLKHFRLLRNAIKYQSLGGVIYVDFQGRLVSAFWRIESERPDFHVVAGVWSVCGPVSHQCVLLLPPLHPHPQDYTLFDYRVKIVPDLPFTDIQTIPIRYRHRYHYCIYSTSDFTQGDLFKDVHI